MKQSFLPICKDGNNTNPLHYRGVELQCTLLKADFTNILNVRMNNILVDKHLGFRRNHVCLKLEHALLVCLIAENRT